MSSSAYTIPSSWTAPTSCFASTNYFYVLLGDNFFSNTYGTPTPVLDGNTPTGDCIPPSDFSIDELYTTDGDCPAGFTKACATGGTRRGESVSTVTCCPIVTDDVFSFMCRDNEYGCHATATKGVVWTGRVTNIGLEKPTDEPITRKPTTDEGIEAWGIKLLQVSPTETSTTEQPASTTEESRPRDTAMTSPGSLETSRIDLVETTESSEGLSAAAVAGVAIGCASAVGLLGLVAFLLYRRRKRAEQSTQSTETVVMNPAVTNDYKFAQPRIHVQPESRPAGMWSGARRNPGEAWELP